MKILLFTKDEVLSDILSIALEGVLALETELSVKDEDASDLLKNRSDISAFVVESESDTSESLTSARKKKIPILRVTSKEGNLRPPVNEGEYVLIKPIVVQNFLELVRVAIKDDSPKDDLFCRVRLDTLLLAGSTFYFDVYVRLSDAKYVKVIKHGDPFDSEKYAHFAGKGLQHLYVPKENFLEYMRSMAASLTSSIEGDPGSFTLENAIDTSTKVHEAVQSSMTMFGITPEAQQVIKLTIDLATTSIQKNPRLKDLLKSLTKNQESYVAWHSVALCYLACKISSVMSWDSQNTHYKLSISALLHDIAIKNPEWAKAKNIDDLKKMGLSEQDIADYLKHPLMASDLSKQMKDYPGDVEYIIAQHHELPDGSGFPHHLNHTKISPLSSLFIVAHDLCHHLYDEGDKFELSKFLIEFDKKYPLGYFRKIRSALEKVMQEETSS